MNTLIGSFITASLLYLMVPAVSWSKGGSDRSLGARAEKRESSRWTLSEWLEQRDRNRMMDLWLSMNSPSPFEFMLGGGSHDFKTSISSPVSEVANQHNYSGELQAYAQFIGLSVEHQNNTVEKVSDLTGMLNLRLLGDSLQNSSLTLHFGQRTRNFEQSNQSHSVRNLLSQASLQIYFTKFFGIDGKYRHYEAQEITSIQTVIGGNYSEAGIFLDFKAIRIYGAGYRDLQLNKTTTTETTTTREGIKTGIKIFY